MSTDTNQQVGSISICFFTKLTDLPAQAPDTNFSIPANTTPQGLTALLNELMKAQGGSNISPQPFDFLIDDEFVCVPLDKFLRRRGITAEGVIRIEYIPAMRAQEGSKLPHDDWVAAVTVPVAGSAQQCFVTASYDRGVRVWLDEQCVATAVSHLDAVKSVAHRPGSVSIADEKAGKRRTRNNNNNSDEQDKKNSFPEGSAFEFLSGGKDGAIRAWKFVAPNKLTCTGGAKAHVNGVDCVAVNKLGTLAASASWDCSVKVWDYASVADANTPQRETACQPALSFADHTRPVLATTFTNSGDKLCSTGLDGTVKLYDVAKGSVELTGPASHAAQCMAERPGDTGAGSLILTGHTDNRLRLFDTRANRIVTAWSGHRQWVYSVCWLVRDDDPSPIGSTQPMIASASEDATVRVWDLRSTFGALMTFDKIHNDGVLGVTYGGAATIVSCGKDNRTKTVSVSKSNE